MLRNALIRRVIRTAALCAITCQMLQCLTPTCERERITGGGVSLTGRHVKKKASEQRYIEEKGEDLYCLFLEA